MAGTAVLSTIKHDVSGAATTFRDGAGNEIGRFCRASVNYTGSTLAVNGSFNISSLTRSSAGNYGVNYSISFPSSGNSPVPGSTGWWVNIASITSSSVGIQTFQTGSFATYDAANITIATFT